MKSEKVVRHRVFFFFLLGLFLVTVLTRLYALTSKPIHFDESINGWFATQMHSVGFYRYDPTNYHGPLYFYLLYLFEIFWGRSLEILRMVSSVFSVLSVMLFAFPVLRNRQILSWMLLFVLLSPAFLFFGRSGIHEMSFVFFQLLAALGLLRWLENSDEKAWGFFLVGLFGMMTLKETFVITLFSGAVALLSLGRMELLRQFSLGRLKQAWTRRLSWLTVFLLVIFTQLFTGFSKNFNGLLDFVRAFLPWLKTGVYGNGHDKAPTYWLQVMLEAEPLALVGVATAVVGIFSYSREWRFISVFSIVQLLVYSVIPYKTVWCILTLMWSFYFVLAYALVHLQGKKIRGSLLVLIAITGAVDVTSIYRSVYKTVLDFNHPYIYVNSSYEFQEMQEYIYAQEKMNPEILKQPIQIGMTEQWPWPWVLRDYDIASYQQCGKSIHPQSIIYFCDSEDMLNLEMNLEEPYWKVTLSVREDRGVSHIYLKKSIFRQVPFNNVTVVGGHDL